MCKIFGMTDQPHVVANTEPVTVDVRNEIRSGIEPFATIMEAIRFLGPGQSLRLLAPFKPLPLLRLLVRKGFSHVAAPLNEGDWEVLFERRNPVQPQRSAGFEPSGKLEHGSACSGAAVCDCRGLEPPQPLVAILEVLSGVPTGGSLRTLTDRPPVQLYPHLAERGFAWETEEHHDGSFITHIHHK